MSIKDVNKSQVVKCPRLGRERVKPKTYCTKEVVDKKTGEVKAVSDGKTRNEFKDETDANLIMKRFTKGQSLTHLSKARPVFADATQFGDFQSIMNQVARAREGFERIPAKIRARFNNKVGELVAFLQDPANLDEAIKLGLVDKKEPAKEPAPQKVVIVKDETTPPQTK